MRHIIISLLLIWMGCGSLTFLQAKEKVTVKQVTGKAIIKNITPEEARQKALRAAKIKALRKAGVSEKITETNVKRVKAQNSDIQKTFNSIATVAISGHVIDYEITHTKKDVDQFNNLYIEVTINATVIKYDREQDPAFEIKVDNIHSVYREGEKLNFTVTSNNPGYLRIFLFEGKQKSTQIFPNQYEKKSFFPADTTISFPKDEMLEYEVTTRKDKETNHLVFVFTKKEIPFMKKVNYKNIINWIYRISPDQRRVKYKNFMIRNKAKG